MPILNELQMCGVSIQQMTRKTLDDKTLRSLLMQAGTRPVSPDRAALPRLASRPAPKSSASIHPKTWSVYTHQRLIDCPYRYFSADALSLKPQDEIREALSKSDYGSLVHRIVQAFHSDVSKLPGPWSGALQETHRKQALELLLNISEAVFADAVKDNFQARSWLKQWLTVLPDYLDWEISRQKNWTLRLPYLSLPSLTSLASLVIFSCLVASAVSTIRGTPPSSPTRR